MLESEIEKQREICIHLARKRFPFIKDIDILEGAVDIAMVYALEHWKDGAGFTFIGYVMLVATREVWKTMARETPNLCLKKRAAFMRAARGKYHKETVPPPFRDLARMGEPKTDEGTDTLGVVPERMDVKQYLDAAGSFYRSALVLRYIDGLKLREVAEVLGVSSQAAHNRITRGLDRIRRKFAIRPD